MPSFSRLVTRITILRKDNDKQRKLRPPGSAQRITSTLDRRTREQQINKEQQWMEQS